MVNGIRYFPLPPVFFSCASTDHQQEVIKYLFSCIVSSLTEVLSRVVTNDTRVSINAPTSLRTMAVSTTIPYADEVSTP